MKTGDVVLVIGPAFFEKTTVKDRKKGILYLENGIQTDRQLNAINSKYKIEPFDQDKYDLLLANRVLSRGIDELGRIYREGIKDPTKVKFAARKLTKIINKLK